MVLKEKVSVLCSHKTTGEIVLTVFVNVQELFCSCTERGSGEEDERENLNLNLNLFLFYNGYKLGRMPLFIWPLIQNYNLSTTET